MRRPGFASHESAAASLAVAACALLALLVVTRRVELALLAVIAVAPCLVLLRRPRLGLPSAIVLMMTVPSWYTLGAGFAATYRVTALLALVVVLDAVRTRWTAVDTAFAAMLVYIAVRWWFSPPIPHQQTLIAELVPCTFYIAARLWWRGDARSLLWVLLVSGAVGATTVVQESLHGALVYANPNTYAWQADVTSIFRPGGVFGSPPAAATALSMAALAGLPLVRASTGHLRALAVGCVIACVAGIILTYTRAGYIAFAVGGVVYLFLSRSPLVTPRRVIAIATALAVATAVALPALEQSRTFQEGVLRKGTFAARQGYWELALPIVGRDVGSTIFGVGVNATVSGQFGGPIQASLAEAPTLTVHGTHNQYVLTLLEQGVVGVALFVGWLALPMLIGLRRRGDPVAAALTAMVVAFAVTASVGNSLFAPVSLALLSLATGLLAALSASSERAGDGRAAGRAE